MISDFSGERAKAERFHNRARVMAVWVRADIPQSRICANEHGAQLSLHGESVLQSRVFLKSLRSCMSHPGFL